jgi:hypothetical protein
VSDASQFGFVERDRAVIVQATKFLLPFLVVGDLVATPVKLQHIRADALKRGWAARHRGIGCDETHQKADADQEGACDRSLNQTSATDEDSCRKTTSKIDPVLSAATNDRCELSHRSLHDLARHTHIDLGGLPHLVHDSDVAPRR